ncbi:MAG: choice-of-anchor tandem repeat GloVer-containing protein [Bryobacteraceae bacterium]
MTDKLHRNRIQIPGAIPSALMWGLAILPAMLAIPQATAQTFKVVYTFTGGLDGGGPWGTPLYSGGILYGTAFSGGNPAAGDYGTIYQYDPTFLIGTYLYDFAGQPMDGSAPMGGLATDGFGDFFGTTTQGGFSLDGTIYEYSGGTEFVVANFNGHNGKAPEGGLIMDPVGNLYGTTSSGGANDCGTVFAFSAFGSLVEIYNFGNDKNDGIGPASSLVFQKGVLYGVTTEGGQYGWGTVFSVDIKTKTETVLYNFQGKKNGGTPVGGLALDAHGDLWGTASAGGSSHGNAGNGVVFKLNTKSLKYSLVHTFSGTDGSQPMAALVPDGQGNFYGTTYIGGALGYGTVFELNAGGTLTILYSFTDGTDGAYPYAGVALDSSGNVYGAATQGGQYGWGTLFEITP